jgi:hypothetical protein
VDVEFLPAAMATSVLRARVTEGGDGGAGSFQGDDVVLLVPWVGVERSCTGVRREAERRRRKRLVGAVVRQFWWRKLKLACSVSFGGSWECCSCFGSGMGSSGGG